MLLDMVQVENRTKTWHQMQLLLLIVALKVNVITSTATSITSVMLRR